MISICSNSKLIQSDSALIMGIMNVTPDSFYEGSREQSKKSALLKVEEMIEDGMDILDIGAVSTRPGAASVSADEELDRLMPIYQSIRATFPHLWISLDTSSASVAKHFLDNGVDIINDISAGEDSEMLKTVAKYKVPYVIMHKKGSPANMQNNPSYKNVTHEVFNYLRRKIDECKLHKIDQIIIDPGFGFGKTIAHNYQLLAEMHVLKILEAPILAGVSRKSMIYKLINTSPDEALNGTTALHMECLRQGAKILRVHDVREAKETISLYDELNKYLS